MKKIIYCAVLLSAGLFMACGSDTTEDQEPLEDTTVDNELKMKVEKAQKVFYTVPSPLETASIFQKAGAEYNAEILNPIENVTNYSTNKSKALNFGVYGADLSYTNIFEQTQESMFYMNCAKKLSDELGITSAFDAATMERIEENINNRDSIMQIINDSYWIADSYLKENEQDELSALIISGGWIEGLYLGTRMIDSNNPNEEITDRIADQKHSLDNLLGLLESYDNSSVAEVRDQLKELKTSFDQITEEDAESDVDVNNSGEVATIGGGISLKYDIATINEISEKIESIRNEIIQ